MNILVTGGCGFVGSHLINELVKDHKVYCLDNLFTGDKDNINDKCHYFFGETKNINSILENISIDIIFHLGEYSRVEQSFEDIDKVFKYNWNSIYEILKFTKKNQAKIIYAGSSTKFGDDGSCRLSNPYAFTKSINTDLVKTYCKWFDIDYAITYFYNVYGEREISTGKYATVIAKFINLKKQGIDLLPITRPGTQKRNFTHINDIIDGLYLVGFGAYGDDFGIGSDESYSIIDIAEMLDMKYELMPEKKGNRMSAPVKSDKTKMLGWKCKYTLKDYLTNI